MVLVIFRILEWSKDQSHVLSAINQPTTLRNFVLLLPVPALHFGLCYNMWKIDLLSGDLHRQWFSPLVSKVVHWFAELFLVDSSSFCWYIVDLCMSASKVGLRIILQKGGVTKRKKKRGELYKEHLDWLFLCNTRKLTELEAHIWNKSFKLLNRESIRGTENVCRSW